MYGWKDYTKEHQCLWLYISSNQIKTPTGDLRRTKLEITYFNCSGFCPEVYLGLLLYLHQDISSHQLVIPRPHKCSLLSLPGPRLSSHTCVLPIVESLYASHTFLRVPFNEQSILLLLFHVWKSLINEFYTGYFNYLKIQFHFPFSTECKLHSLETNIFNKQHCLCVGW